MMMNSVIPLKFPRLVFLFLAFAWALVSFAVGINAFIKSNAQQDRIKSQVPRPTSVSIDINNVLQSGGVSTGISAVIAALCFVYMVLLFLDNSRPSGISTHTLRLQYISLAVLAIGLLAVQIPLTVFTATRSAQVAAFIDGIKLPNTVVKVVEKAIGVKTAYKDFDYLTLLAILPWFAILFTTIAAIVTFMASSHARSAALGSPVASSGSEEPKNHQQV
ncbi:hypothetical protein C8J57DRAFT_1326933 [Mycena rebaudengoi]|nr:hypothetical protein C8J57DRAFT_1326933 [Mycena rebaudengoi]